MRAIDKLESNKHAYERKSAFLELLTEPKRLIFYPPCPVFNIASPGEFVKLGSVLRDSLGGIDDIHRGLERTSSPGKVGHLHHYHAHVLGQHDDVVTLVVPLAHLHVLVSIE